MNEGITHNSVMAIYFSKQNIGVSVFDKSSLQIQCGLIQSFYVGSAQLLMNELHQRKVTKLITNNQNHIFLGKLDQNVQVTNIDERGLQDDIIQNNISLLKFNPLKQKIQNKTQYLKLMQLESQSQGINKQKFKALGMLLYFLLNLTHFNLISSVFLNDISYFNDKIFNHVQISISELESLQIIKQETHPSLIKGKGRSKQGFSVLSLYQSTLCSPGAKKILRSIFRNPTYNVKQLEDRLDAINWLKQSFLDFKAVVKVLHSVHGIDGILNKFFEDQVEAEEWRKLAKTLQSFMIINKMVEEIAKSMHIPVAKKIQNIFSNVNVDKIGNLLATITSIYDLAEGGIKKGASLHLDELKKIYSDMPHLLTLYARQQNWDDDFRIVFMHQVGYLIRVPHSFQVTPEQEKENWSLQFVKNSGKFYCSSLTETLDDKYGDIYGQIIDQQNKINLQLQNLVCEHSEMLEKAYWKICEFQVYIGVCIVSNGMCRPRFSSQSLIVSRGWHLLLAQEAIQNHIFSFNQNQAPRNKVHNSEQNLVNTNYSNRVMLISGPNRSGKTIYLKQLSIIIFLAHLGFYVPAEFAQICLIDKIILIESRKSIYQGNNGFESEIASLSRVMTPNMFTSKSLILIDEFGSQIDVPLAKKILATILHFLTKVKLQETPSSSILHKIDDNFKIPLTLAVTHLTDVMTSNLVRQDYFLRYLTMDVLKDQTCLFKIKPGLVKKGYGIEYAGKILEIGLVDRARQWWKEIKS